MLRRIYRFSYLFIVIVLLSVFCNKNPEEVEEEVEEEIGYADEWKGTYIGTGNVLDHDASVSHEEYMVLTITKIKPNEIKFSLLRDYDGSSDIVGAGNCEVDTSRSISVKVSSSMFDKIFEFNKVEDVIDGKFSLVWKPTGSLSQSGLFSVTKQ